MTVLSAYLPETKNGNGATTIWSFGFKIKQASDLVVIHVDANGIEAVLSEGTGTANYSVTVASYPGTGSITYPATLGVELPTGEMLILTRVVSILQETDLVNQGDWNPEQVERELDNSRMIDQQLEDGINRSLRLPVSSSGVSVDLPSPVAGSILGWNSGATALTNLTPNTDTYLSASVYMLTVLEAPTAAEARTDLGLGALSVLDEVATANIPDNAVTLAKQSHGTQGGIPYYGATGTPSELAADTLGKVLMTKGTGANPAWEAAPYPPGYVSGLRLSQNSSDTDHDVDITAGYIASDDTVPIALTCAAMTKRSDATFTAGTGNGWLDTGSLANSTAYYPFAIMQADGTQDYLLSLSSSSPTMPTDYIYKALLNEGNPLYTDGSGNLINTFHGVFVSPAQTISAAGSFSLNHGLDQIPSVVQVYLICTTDNNGYLVGEKLPVNFGHQASTVPQSLGIAATSSLIKGKIANYANPFIYPNATTGNNAGLTNGSFSLYIRAER